MTVYRHTLRHAPVGLWQFDGNLNDSSGNGFTLTVESGTAVYGEVAPGVRGVYFDGITQLVYNTFSPLLNIMGDLTIECIIRLIAYPGTGVGRMIASHAALGETYSTNFAYEFAVLGGPNLMRMLWESAAGANSAYTISSSLVLGSLNHIAVTRTSNVVQFYLNGKAWGAASSALTPGEGGQTGRFRVGDANTTSYAPNCLMSSLKIISRALSAAEIKAEYGRTLGPQFSSYSAPSNLDVFVDDTLTINDAVSIPVRYHDTTHSPVGLWQFNGNMNDSSGNSFTLTVSTGTERYSEILPGLTGFYFDGSTTVFRNAAEATLQITGDYTIEMLLLLPPIVQNAVLVSMGDSGGTSASNYLFDITTNNTFSLANFSESGTKSGNTLARPLASLPYNQPCHFAMTKTSNVIQFWLNGAVIGTSGSQTATTGGSLDKLRVGGDASAPSLAGVVASLKIVASALNSTQIAAEYSRTIGRLYDSVVALT